MAGVAPITVSRVINNDGYFSEETRRKVEAAVLELDYIPNSLGPSLRSKRTQTLALVLSDITNPFWTTVARGVEDAGCLVCALPTTASQIGGSGLLERSHIAQLPQADYIFIRYGLNDARKREDFDANFPKDFHELIARLRKDHPGAMIIPTTVIAFSADAESSAPQAKRINDLVRRIAEEEKLPIFDLYPGYAAALAKGGDMLNYRRYALSKVPENLRAIATPYVSDPAGKDPTIVVMDNRIDAIFGHLPGWFSDRHPNLAGYNVIAAATAKWLAPILREKSGAAK